MVEELNKALNDARRVFVGPKPDLVINKVPKDVLNGFKKFADDNFLGNYGFALKWLWDFYLPKNYELEKRVEMLESVIGKLIDTKDEPKEPKKEIRLGNGKKILVK